MKFLTKMLVFHNPRMGISTFPSTPLSTCNAAYWSPAREDWFHPYYPAMTEIIDVHSLPPSSPQVTMKKINI